MDEKQGSQRDSHSFSAPAGVPETPRLLLTIAGFDPSSGAGFTADLKVFAAHGYLGLAAATALTVQSTRGVRAVEPVRAPLLAATLACLAEDAPLLGIKIGMLATEANTRAVAGFLATLAHGMPVVLDPVLRATSGAPLLEQPALRVLVGELLPRVTCITPNAGELKELAAAARSHIADRSLADPVDTLRAAFPGLGIVVTGGDQDPPVDTVFATGEAAQPVAGARIDTPATHGTGCAYSSALLCGLASGQSLLEAARAAKQHVTGALAHAMPYGQGGAMHHLYEAFRREGQTAPHRTGSQG